MRCNCLKSFSIFIVSLFCLQACSEQGKRQPTAADNVTVISQQLNMPGLNRSRTLRIYLPPDYKMSEKNIR